ncbi:siderophore-interacting protein [Mumia zhuanghuii]|uniref:Siderophore-interacting protein n=1 Tax=Mumia zhuanghuii TaxID=2585211 RepID=A0A5C4MQT9_9ACTN|nr:siderophore-interacting protein [Mumia zhuanghuii]TNC46806.1 siderophore-interacting protein [Mumia zhuanghuii]TNC47146.1 siderophore-interacting protein [Mumia zhuanghuii]
MSITAQPESSATKGRRLPLRFEVVSSERLTPLMQRVVFSSHQFVEFARKFGGFADSYVKLVFLPEGFDYPDPLDLDFVKDTYPPEAQPTIRTYTLRAIDLEHGRITIDFVLHGDSGVAGPWAASAQPGDTLHLTGPGGAYAPDPVAPWHLVAGDEAALPAIQATLEAMPAGARVHAYVEVDGPDDEQPVVSEAHVALTWLHRRGAAPGSTTLIADAVRADEWPPGDPQVFIHGEAGLLKQLRSYLLNERGVPRERLSLSGYWRKGATEEGFRAWKASQPKV